MSHRPLHIASSVLLTTGSAALTIQLVTSLQGRQPNTIDAAIGLVLVVTGAAIRPIR